ncbi:hypothetical protein G9F72_023210 [Clostridium estertheticum]|uniref:hypothetical protein n=1 Tax=Clostridium estertheticum TaxID=238834 RepID=UPI0013E967AB|nr:hypothetical protein [Clostridium estertheticum]MBZ9689211.1 hypothetical protein [Clostridium estertheticum]
MSIINRKLILTLKKARRYAMLNWYNSKGWSTDKKYIVIESDDWGSIRTATPKAYKALIEAGDNIDKDPFTRYDALASEDDLELLFGVLSGFKDKNGKPPVITANCAVANPDFDRIRESKFENYYFEPFTETLKKYEKHADCFELWKNGMENKVFFPQLHCREHMNITKWIHDLRNGDKNLHLAFKHNMISGGNSFSDNNLFAYMDAFNYYGVEYDEQLETIVSDAVSLFRDIFGYESKSFVASCYVWNSSLERVLKEHKIDYIQGARYQLVPTVQGYSCFDKQKHMIGEKNNYKQLYLVRNCYFEPSLGNRTNEVDLCLAQISNSFKWKKPATISSHRLNYVGYIDESNRDTNLQLLQRLLVEILKKWPDVEFVTSEDLGNIIKESEKNKC